VNNVGRRDPLKVEGVGKLIIDQSSPFYLGIQNTPFPKISLYPKEEESNLKRKQD